MPREDETQRNIDQLLACQVIRYLGKGLIESSLPPRYGINGYINNKLSIGTFLTADKIVPLLCKFEPISIIRLFHTIQKLYAVPDMTRDPKFFSLVEKKFLQALGNFQKSKYICSEIDFVNITTDKLPSNIADNLTVTIHCNTGAPIVFKMFNLMSIIKFFGPYLDQISIRKIKELDNPSVYKFFVTEEKDNIWFRRLCIRCPGVVTNYLELHAQGASNIEDAEKMERASLERVFSSL